MTVQAENLRHSSRPRTRSWRVAQAMVDVCRGREPALGDDQRTGEDFILAVRHHRIAPLAHVALRDVNPAVAQALRTDREDAITMHLRAAVALDELGRLLDGVPWLTFKGPALSEVAHPVPGLRTYRDLDVLVAPESLREVTARLAGAGWELSDHGETLRLPDVRGECHWRTGTGLMVDVHWSMLNMGRERRRLPIDTTALLDRRVPLGLGFVSADALEPVDGFVHVCLHAALSGADRMLHLLDIDQLSSGVNDWDAVIRRAHEWSAGVPVAMALRRAQSVLGTKVPTRLDRALGVPRGFAVVARATDHVLPVPRLRTDASLTRLVARAARQGSSATYTSLASKSIAAVWDRLPWQQQPAPELRRADAAALAVYLDGVEGQLSGGPRRQPTVGG
jgi:hypothetical protein